MRQLLFALATAMIVVGASFARSEQATNPILYADVPDASLIRVGDTYYMSSTTMHMSPGLPLMKSKDLVNWRLLNYAYETLGDADPLRLENGQSDYGRGSWASSLRHHDGMFYVTTFCATTNQTYVFSTPDIESTPWERRSFTPSMHDHSLYFADDGRVYMLWGAGKLRLTELEPDFSGVKQGGFDKVIIENASAPAGDDIMLPAEGSQLFEINGKFYLLNIVWPRGGMRTVLVHRADKLEGPYEGRVAFQDQGVAQGGLIETPSGDWYAYLFQDHGAVGRIPYLVPVTWDDGWPILGVAGKTPMKLDLPASNGLITGVVDSDEFDRSAGDAALPLVWQWNHNPDPQQWSVADRPGFLRLTTSRLDETLVAARNTLTQRTIGPECTGTIALDASGLRDGDTAGLCLLQQNYGYIGVTVDGAERRIVMVQGGASRPRPGAERSRAFKSVERVVDSAPLDGERVFLRASCDFRKRADVAHFSYSVDGQSWTPLGDALTMRYTLPHFMGYRFGLFNFATQTPGGHADFDYFHIDDAASPED